MSRTIDDYYNKLDQLISDAELANQRRPSKAHLITADPSYRDAAEEG